MSVQVKVEVEVDADSEVEIEVEIEVEVEIKMVTTVGQSGFEMALKWLDLGIESKRPSDVT